MPRFLASHRIKPDREGLETLPQVLPDQKKQAAKAALDDMENKRKQSQKKAAPPATIPTLQTLNSWTCSTLEPTRWRLCDAGVCSVDDWIRLQSRVEESDEEDEVDRRQQEKEEREREREREKEDTMPKDSAKPRHKQVERDNFPMIEVTSSDLIPESFQ